MKKTIRKLAGTLLMTVVMAGYTLLLPFTIWYDALRVDFVRDFKDVWVDYVEYLRRCWSAQNNSD